MLWLLLAQIKEYRFWWVPILQRSKIIRFLVSVTVALTASSTSNADVKDRWISIDQYAALHGLTKSDANSVVEATGIIVCPYGQTSAFLVQRNDLVLTSAHFLASTVAVRSFFNPKNTCKFGIRSGAMVSWFDVEKKSYVLPAGGFRYVANRTDWALLSLKSSVTGIVPYRLPETAPKTDDAITMVWTRPGNSEQLAQDCSVKRVWAVDGLANGGFETNCQFSSDPSGSPILRKTKDGLEVIGIQSSFRSCSDKPGSECNNWAIAVHEQMRSAVLRLTNPMRYITKSPPKVQNGLAQSARVSEKLPPSPVEIYAQVRERYIGILKADFYGYGQANRMIELGRLTYEQRRCGKEIVSNASIDQKRYFAITRLKLKPQIVDSMANLIATDLEKMFVGSSPVQMDSLCKMARYPSRTISTKAGPGKADWQ